MVFVAEGDMNEPALFRLGDFRLQKGMTLKDARIVYRTYGKLNADRSNAILYPTSYAAHHTDIEWLIGEGRVLDPERWFVVIPNMFGNGLSSSPSTTPFRSENRRVGKECVPTCDSRLAPYPQ